MTLEIPVHFIHEIKTKGYDVIGVKAFLHKLMNYPTETEYEAMKGGNFIYPMMHRFILYYQPSERT